MATIALIVANLLAIGSSHYCSAESVAPEQQQRYSTRAAANAADSFAPFLGTHPWLAVQKETLPGAADSSSQQQQKPEVYTDGSFSSEQQIADTSSLGGYYSCEVWQDLRMLLSAATGFMLTHFAATCLGRRGSARNSRRQQTSDSPSGALQNRRLKLYCYAM